MSGFKAIKTSIAKSCNWNELNYEILKNVEHLTIIVDELKKDVEGDIEKIKILKSLAKLQSIRIMSREPRNIEYLDTLMKDIKIRKTACLLDDFENKDRSDFDFEKMDYEKVFIPLEYCQWGIKTHKFVGPNSKSFCCYDNELSKEDLKKIDNQIDEWLKIPNLTLVDKVILVSNYLQENMQFVEGKISKSRNKKYIAKDLKNEKDFGNSAQLLNKHIGHCEAFSKIALLMLNNPKMNVNCRLMFAPGHFYNIIYDGEKAYGLDTTWGVTRNPNRVEGNLKAKEFYDGYVLFGQKELDEMNKPSDHHTPLSPLKVPLQLTQFPREEIKKSIEKLKQYGIAFTYPEKVYVNQVEVDESQSEIIQ